MLCLRRSISGPFLRLTAGGFLSGLLPDGPSRSLAALEPYGMLILIAALLICDPGDADRARPQFPAAVRRDADERHRGRDPTAHGGRGTPRDRAGRSDLGAHQPVEMLGAENVIVQVGDPLAARRRQAQIFIPSSRCAERCSNKIPETFRRGPRGKRSRAAGCCRVPRTRRTKRSPFSDRGGRQAARSGRRLEPASVRARFHSNPGRGKARKLNRRRHARRIDARRISLVFHRRTAWIGRHGRAQAKRPTRRAEG